MGIEEQALHETDLALASRISRMRLEAGLSLDDVASRTDVSRASLSRIERGETSPTANVLNRICQAFGVTLSSLLADIEPDPPALIRASDVRTWSDPESGYQRFAVSPPAPGFNVEIVRSQMPPGAKVSYDRSPIANLEQHILVLAGSLSISFGTQTVELEAGDCLRFHINGPTRFENRGDAETNYLVILGKPQ